MEKYDKEADENNIIETLKNDYVENGEYLCSLIRIISSIDCNQTICIDGDWGTGKTFLVNQLIYLIQNYKDIKNHQEILSCVKNVNESLKNIAENNLVFYYNAWANDDHDDPLSSIIYNILNDYPKYKDEVIEENNYAEALKNIVKIASKIVSKKLLDVDLSSEINANKIKTFEDLAENINTYEERKENFGKLLNLILKDKRMILIIDELDRCNPRFATKLLEVIKHFYNFKNVTVIIVANNKGLLSTINHEYGENFDSYSYLNKFYDYIMTIDNNRSVKYAQNYLKFKSETYLSHDIFYTMINKYNFTFRDCNKYRTLYDTVENFIETQTGFFSLNSNEELLLKLVIIPIILSFKIKDYNAYENCLKGNTEELKDAIKYVNYYFNNTIYHKHWLESLIVAENDSHQITDEYIANKITNLFLKIYRNDNLNKIFLNRIKMSMQQ